MKSSSVNVWSNLKFLRTAAKNLEACKRKRDKNKGEADGKACCTVITQQPLHKLSSVSFLFLIFTPHSLTFCSQLILRKLDHEVYILM